MNSQPVQIFVNQSPKKSENLLVFDEKPNKGIAMPVFLQKRLAKSLNRKNKWDREDLDERIKKAQKIKDEKIQSRKAKASEMLLKIEKGPERLDHIAETRKEYFSQVLNHKMTKAEALAKEARAKKVESAVKFGTEKLIKAHENKIQMDKQHEKFMWNGLPQEPCKFDCEKFYKKAEWAKKHNYLISKKKIHHKLAQVMDLENKRISDQKRHQRATERKQRFQDLKLFKVKQRALRMKDRSTSMNPPSESKSHSQEPKTINLGS